MSRIRQSDDDTLLVRSLGLRMPGGQRLDEHAHGWAQVVYAAEGVLAVEVERSRWIVPPHRALWVPADVPHRVETVGATWMRTVYLHPSLIAGTPDAIRVLEVAPLLRELILECVRIGMLDGRDEHQRSLATVLRDQLHRAADLGLALPLPLDQRARRVADRLLAEPGLDLPLETLAHDAAASQRTIERLFRLETGLSFGRWRQQARLQHAVRLLAEGIAVTRVAMACGYESPSAFTQAFRRSFGATPGRYRHTP